MGKVQVKALWNEVCKRFEVALCAECVVLCVAAIFPGKLDFFCKAFCAHRFVVTNVSLSTSGGFTLSFQVSKSVDVDFIVAFLFRAMRSEVLVDKQLFCRWFNHCAQM